MNVLEITLRVTVEPTKMCEADLKASMGLAHDQEWPGDMEIPGQPQVHDHSAADYAEVVADSVNYAEEAFGGSMIWARFKDTKIISANFVPEKPE